MKWMQNYNSGPFFYVDDNCMVWGQTQEFLQHGGGGPSNMQCGFQAYFKGKEVGRFTDESQSKKCVETAYKNAQ